MSSMREKAVWGSVSSFRTKAVCSSMRVYLLRQGHPIVRWAVIGSAGVYELNRVVQGCMSSIRAPYSESVWGASWQGPGQTYVLVSLVLVYEVNKGLVSLRVSELKQTNPKGTRAVLCSVNSFWSRIIWGSVSSFRTKTVCGSVRVYELNQSHQIVTLVVVGSSGVYELNRADFGRSMVYKLN